MNAARKYDKWIAIVFAALTIVFIFFSITSHSFFNWIFERHQNQMSWYVRPFFLLPFCYFSYRHSWAGISVTIFCLLTSMFWFNKPDIVSDDVKTFLQFEKEWLYSEWNFRKLLLILLVPASFITLGLAFWKRSLWMGLTVVFLMATGKIIWSILNAGESGGSIIVPAIIGLVICLGLIYYVFKQLERRNPDR